MSAWLLEIHANKTGYLRVFRALYLKAAARFSRRCLERKFAQ
jgi:hypothetical protein